MERTIIYQLKARKETLKASNDWCKSVESGKSNIFIIQEYSAPNMSLKIRYNFLGHPICGILLYTKSG